MHVIFLMNPPFVDLAQLVKTLVAYWLGALLKVAGSNPGGSMYYVQWLLIFIKYNIIEQ